GYTFINYGRGQGLPHSEVSDFLETREGEFWVATDGGLVRFNPKAPPEPRVVYANEAVSRAPHMFTVVVPEDEERNAKRITTLLEDREGTIWCGTYKGLYQLERAEGRLTMRPIEFGILSEWPERRIIQRLLEDRRGSVWVGAACGFYRPRPVRRSARFTQRGGFSDTGLGDAALQR